MAKVILFVLLLVILISSCVLCSPISQIRADKLKMKEESIEGQVYRYNKSQNEKIKSKLFRYDQHKTNSLCVALCNAGKGGIVCNCDLVIVLDFYSTLF